MARRCLVTTYVLLVMGFLLTHGVPSSTLKLTLVAIGGLFLSCIGRGWRLVVRVCADWAPFVAVLTAYTLTRGTADSFGLAVHEQDLADAERWLFGGVEPTAWIQAHLYDSSAGSATWYDGLLTLVYTSHFVVTPMLTAVLWLRDRAAWLLFTARFVVLSIAGLATYIVFPAAPPWLAAQDGVIQPIERLSARGWTFFGLDHVASALTDGQKAANSVAAMPSLHTAMSVLVALTIGARISSRWRWLLAVYPAAMALALVYFGEHWVLDVLAGLAYALAAYWVVGAVARRRHGAPAPAVEQLPPELAPV